VVETNRYLLLENTDEHGDFRQFLKSSKMGSSIYVPIIASHGMVGQIVAAAQARWTYSSLDVAPMRALAAAAALIWEAKNGEAWWANDYPASDAWYANKQQVDQ
jgi:signal transduction protein with GAF and PtsI domain